jgi:CheY-like chemotaxis protein
MGNDHLDAQVSARLLKRAQTIKGGREQLAKALGVHPHDLALWVAGKTFPPQAIFEKVVALILDAHEGRAAMEGAAPIAGSSRRPRALVADSPAGVAVIAKMLGDEFDIIPVHVLTEALDILQGAAATQGSGIDVIVCGQHFDGSQMLHFLECVKAYAPTSQIPFVCCRATATYLRDQSLAAMREACEALGAVAYIDLPEHERHGGTEAAAVTFRDAVRAGVRVRRQATLQVIVADDNPDAAHTLSALLRMAGYEVHKASTGAEALKLAMELKPAVIVLDLAMPGISGYDVAKRIRAEPWGAGVTLIALTGYADDPERAAQAGFNHHFLKPVQVERLLEVFPPAAEKK